MNDREELRGELLTGVAAYIRSLVEAGALARGQEPPSTIVTDDEARTVREIVQRHEALGDPYAWHKGLEDFLRNRRTP